MPETDTIAATAIQRLGLDPKNLGCVMLDVEMPDIYRHALDPKWAYYSSVLNYVNGCEGRSHVTLLYGLLNNPQTDRDLIDGVLEGWRQPSSLYFDTVDCFPGNDGVANYGCIVLKPNETRVVSDVDDMNLAALHDANYRLGKLPHVRSFPDYNPHVTVGYVQERYIPLAKAAIQTVAPRAMSVAGLNYGDV